MDVEAGMTDQKDQWIDALVTGGGFMDVGWLYGTRNEKVTRSLKGDVRNTPPCEESLHKLLAARQRGGPSR
jgi:hypothetical protein